MASEQVILGIDTSCDDSGVGIVVDGTQILANVRASQEFAHVQFGGIVPSVAARRHALVIHSLIEEALRQSGLGLHDLSAIGVTNQQGLAPALCIGVAAAKSLALSLEVPLIPVHHVDAHVYSIEMTFGGAVYPFLCLAVAGGHTMLLMVHSRRDYEMVGTTRDDSAGEAFDKVARELNLGYPGGPGIEMAAARGDAGRFLLPRPLSSGKTYDLSFSGLKTSTNRLIRSMKDSGSFETDPTLVADIAASFQAAVFDSLLARCLRYLRSNHVSRMAVVGGVAASATFRLQLNDIAAKTSVELLIPPPEICTDNGAMIAGLAAHLPRVSPRQALDLDVHANAELGLRGLRYRASTKYRDVSS